MNTVPEVEAAGRCRRLVVLELEVVTIWEATLEAEGVAVAAPGVE